MSARRDLDYFKLLKESRETSASERPANKKIRLAVIGDCATQTLTVLLRVLFSRHGLDADIYEGACDAAEGEARNPRSGLYRHDPEVVIVLNTVQALRDKFYQRSGSAGGLPGGAGGPPDRGG